MWVKDLKEMKDRKERDKRELKRETKDKVVSYFIFHLKDSG
jgi:hypothetical protein